jgi:predicted cobalt transporter CbtA
MFTLIDYTFFKPSIVWYRMASANFIAGLLWGLATWFVSMRAYGRAKRAKNNPN